MDIINHTPFSFAFIAGRIPYPGHSLTLIVKGTFDLSPDKAASPAEEQIFPTGDVFYPDDEEKKGGPRYPSDFAYFKPLADILLVGKCHAPKGSKVPARQVKFGVGLKSKSLNVFGNRYWRRGLLGSAATEPAPFSEMELRYENSFGGNGYLKNPVGKGIDKSDTGQGGELHPLPNILLPGEKISSPRDRIEPAGFGPIGHMWQQRFSRLGTYKGNYMKEHWPWFPKDFDWSYFNAAPNDMQVEGYLRGNEALFFENLHPENTHYKADLPGLRVRCFVNRQNSGPAPDQLDETRMELDTLWIDMEANQLVLVWRGWTQVLSDEFEELKNIYIVSEDLSQPSGTVDYYRELFSQEGEQPVEEDKEPEEKEIAAAVDIDIEQEIKIAEEKMKAGLIAAGFDPENLPPPSEESKLKEALILKELGIDLTQAESQPITREHIKERIARRESFAGEDLTGMDLSGLQMIGLDLQHAILKKVSLKNSDLTDADLTGANLEGADLTGVVLRKAGLKDADLTWAVLSEADLTGAVLDDAILRKANLEGAVLCQITAVHAYMPEANLTGASVKGSKLTGASLSGCILTKTDFTGSDLSEVSVEGASGVEVNMSETNLAGFRASEGCDFSKGSFIKALGPGSIWEKAELSDTDFSYAHLEGADFKAAVLNNANFFAADMKFSRFVKARLTDAKLIQMNLFQGSMEKADLTRTDLRGANLYGVEFLNSIIDKTNLEFANLKMTKLAKQE